MKSGVLGNSGRRAGNSRSGWATKTQRHKDKESMAALFMFDLNSQSQTVPMRDGRTSQPEGLLGPIFVSPSGSLIGRLQLRGEKPESVPPPKNDIRYGVRVMINLVSRPQPGNGGNRAGSQMSFPE